MLFVPLDKKSEYEWSPRADAIRARRFQFLFFFLNIHVLQGKTHSEDSPSRGFFQLIHHALHSHSAVLHS